MSTLNRTELLSYATSYRNSSLRWITIPLNGKIPAKSGWTKLTAESNIESQWQDGNNMGLPCGILNRVIVFDVDNKEGGVEDWHEHCRKYGEPQTLKVISGGGGLHYYFHYNERVAHLKNAAKMAISPDGRKMAWDIRTEGGQIVLPPSIHPDSGRPYTWVEPMVPVSEMPDWMIKIMSGPPAPKQPQTTGFHGFEIVGIFPDAPKTKNVTRANAAGPKKEYTRLSVEALGEILGLLAEWRADGYDDWRNTIWAIKSCCPSESEDSFYLELAHDFSARSTKYENGGEAAVDKLWVQQSERNGAITAGSLMFWLKEDIGDEEYRNFRSRHQLGGNKDFEEMCFEKGDDGHADIFVEAVKNDIKCVDVKHNAFVLWNEATGLWDEGTIDHLIERVVKILPPIVMEEFGEFSKRVAAIPDPERQKQMQSKLGFYLKIAKSAYLVTHAAAVARVAKVRLYEPTFMDKLDSNNDLFPIKGKRVINLRTGEVRERVRDDYFSFECPVNYDPNASSEVIDRFLADITLKEEGLPEYLQAILGSCLTGHTFLQEIYIFHGPEGGNGKSTLIGLMTAILGKYFCQLSKEVVIKLDGARAGAASPFLAELRGRRMAAYCESEEGDRLNEGQIKAFTGGDRIKCRALYMSGIEFTAHFKAFILTNFRILCTMDPALWRRLVRIPFNCKFVDNPAPAPSHERKRDPRFKDEIANSEEAKSAFLNWLIAGAMRMYGPPLVRPAAVIACTQEYKQDMDVYARFVEEELDREPRENSEWLIGATELWERFCNWCMGKIKPPSQTEFGKNIKRVIGEAEKIGGYKKYRGVRFHVLEAPAPQNPPTNGAAPH